MLEFAQSTDQLSDFQKNQLKNMRNHSQKSNLIIFGDCLDRMNKEIDAKYPWNKNENISTLSVMAAKRRQEGDYSQS